MILLPAYLIYGSLKKLEEHNGHENGLVLDESKGLEQAWGCSGKGEEAHLGKDDHL